MYYVLGNCPQMQSEAKKSGKYPSKNKASPIDFETQISLRTYAPPKRSPSKKAFEKYKPGAYFRNFTVIY